MAKIRGRALKIEIAATFSTAKVVTSITKANPAVLTSTAHGLADGAIGFIDAITGMDEALGQACSVDSPAANTFNLEGLDTTSYSSAATAGSFTPVATWSTLATAVDYEIGGGTAEQIDETALIDRVKQLSAGMLEAQTVTINGFSDAISAATALVRAAAINDGFVLMRITASNGERRIFRGQPGLPGESVAVNQTARNSVQVTVKGLVLFLPA